MLNNLGISFLCRFERTGNLENLTNAIQNLHRAVQLTPDGHADLPARLNNLGNLLSRRFERTGNLKDLSNALHNQQCTVQLTPDEHAQLAGRLNNLGISYLRRFEHTGAVKDMYNAIQYATQLTIDGHTHLPGMLNNMAPRPDDLTTNFSALSENIRKLVRYRHGLGLHNDKPNNLRGKLSIELRWRPAGSCLDGPWQPARMSMPGGKGFPLLQEDDHIACVIRNNSDFKVWPYVLEFAEEGTVALRYPNGYEEGNEGLEATRVVSTMSLRLASHYDAFPSGEPRNRRERVTEVLKLFVSTEQAIDLTWLLQSPLQRDNTRRTINVNCQVGPPLGMSSDLSSHGIFVTYS